MTVNTFIRDFMFTRKGLLLCITSLLLSASFGQKNAGAVKGILADSVTHQPVTDASISVLKEKDSSVVSFAISSDKGHFEVKHLGIGSYILLISYEGLETLKKSFSVSAPYSVVDFGVLNMKQAYKMLEEVVVKDQVPIKVNGDTVAYNAGAFKTKPNATVEDLLKKLPGVQVDKNGNVKAQGEQVQKVYVDGKEFFGDNPKIATRNLTADMIDQVQVFDDRSDQAKFSGIDDGSRSKTINLTLKKDKKSGTFAKVSAGYGTNNRYNEGININHFKGTTQISLIAGINNINSPGYNISNTTNTANSEGVGLGASGDGIIQTSLVGLDYRDLWSKDLDVSASYYFNHTNTTNLSSSAKQTFLADSTLLTNSSTIYNNIDDNHNFNTKIVYTIDTFNSIIYRGSFIVQNAYDFDKDTLTDFIQKKENKYKADDNKTVSSTNNKIPTWRDNLIWQRRFNKKGRTLSVNISHAFIRGNRTGDNEINSRFYNPTGSIYKEINTTYRINNNDQTDNYGVALSYTEPINANKFLEFNITHYDNKNASNIKTYNYNSITKQYDKLIDTLTNQFENANKYNRVGTNLKWVNKKYSYQVGFSVQETLLKNNDLSKKKSLAQRYINFIPAASLNYRFSKSKSLQINYRGTNNAPDISQLQNITDLSDYPYIRKGNPELKQEFVNNIALKYNSFNRANLKSLFVFINYNSISNKIVNSIEQNGGEQILMPVNCGGVFDVSGTIDFGLPLKETETRDLNISTNIDYSNDANIINGYKNYIKDFSLGEEISFNLNYQDKLDLSADASIAYNAINYTIQKDQNISFFTNSFSIDAAYTFPKGFILSTTANYTHYTQRSEGYNQHYIMWNASISKQLFKDNQGELTLTVNDILNKNINVSRTVYDNSIEDVQTNVLKRFGLLTFTYNFK